VDTDEIWHAIDAQRADLADLLDTLTPQQWATPSLCDGWSVRHVAAHLTHANRSWLRLGAEAARSGFRFDAMMDRMARQDAREPAELTAALRAMVGRRRRPPGTTVADPLMDALVHGQDIAVPLGIARPMPTAAAVLVAERLWSMTFPMHPAKRYAGVQFRATDADFTAGDGTPLEGPIHDIVLTLAGRPAPELAQP
jgi:uncharacterized protein (TIGR03083 family)